MTDEIEERLAELEQQFQVERRRRQSLEDRLEKLAGRVADLEERTDDQGSRLTAVENDYENLAGVAASEQSTALKRRVDLVLILKRKAEANGGVYAMDYSQVQDDLAAHGHPDVGDKQAFRDMDRIAERVGGVSYPVSHPVSGNNAVELDLDAYHGVPSEMAAVSDNVSSQGNGAARSEQNHSNGDPMKSTR